MAPGGNGSEDFAPEKAEADLMRRRAEAIAKRLRTEWTFQKPLAERAPVEAMEDNPEDRRHRAEGRTMANEQYVGERAYGELPGISKEEIAEIRSRGPKRDESGEYVPTEQSEVVVPTRDRQTYQAPAKRGANFQNEDTEAGEWRKKAYTDKGVEVRTQYHRGEEQEKRRLGVTEFEEATADGVKTTSKLTRTGAATPADTSASKGGAYGGSSTGSEIFAMDTEGQIYATDPRPKVERDANRKVKKVETQHHSSLVHGEDVIGAGEIRVTGGVVQEVTDLSGHYKPSPRQMADAINEMEAQGIPMIDDEGRRAKVKLKGAEKATGVTTEMSFETFSQTGGNVDQIHRKAAMVDQLKGLAGAGGEGAARGPTSGSDLLDKAKAPVQASPVVYSADPEEDAEAAPADFPEAAPVGPVGGDPLRDAPPAGDGAHQHDEV